MVFPFASLPLDKSSWSPSTEWPGEQASKQVVIVAWSDPPPFLPPPDPACLPSRNWKPVFPFFLFFLSSQQVLVGWYMRTYVYTRFNSFWASRNSYIQLAISFRYQNWNVTEKDALSVTISVTDIILCLFSRIKYAIGIFFVIISYLFPPFYTFLVIVFYPIEKAATQTLYRDCTNFTFPPPSQLTELVRTRSSGS